MGSRLRQKILVVALGLVVVAATSGPVLAVGAKQEGCTPKFWRVNLSYWGDTKYSPTQKFNSIFPLAGNTALGHATLFQLLTFTGDPQINGQSVTSIIIAALLNASHPGVNYPVDLSTLINGINAALAAGSLDAFLEQAAFLQKKNDLGCPLDPTEFR
jgi:hypothetical protein